MAKNRERDPQADRQDQDERRPEGVKKSVDEWVTGDEPATASQLSYLHTLATEAGEDLPEGELTKAQASEHIDRLQEKTGRGKASD